ncbi:MAG: peptide ABC transporter substrate-binding protein [Thermoleophilia bacterium]|nr:peptide ABC transporter substrate-binding protein [Thermoleophilia bacterium]MDH3725480.1 peptide ABC transporter substrate-binding protein [Thermoleophilia bacterium]
MTRRPLSPIWAPIAPLLIFAVVAVVVVTTAAVVSTESDSQDTPASPALVTEPDAGALPGGTVAVSHPGAPASLNRALAIGDTRLVRRLMAPVTGENLLSMQPDYTYVAELAEEVPSESGGGVTRDPFTVRFSLREDAAWSDGTPVSGEDVRFTWQAMIDPDNRVASRAGWSAISDVRVPSPRQVEIEFRRPYAAWRELFSASGKGRGVLLPAHALEEKNLNAVWNDDPPLGTGPYVVETYRPGVSLVLTRNPNYWNTTDPGPFVRRIVHRFRADGEAAARDFVTRRADLVNLRDFSRARELETPRDAAVLATPGATLERLHFNIKDPVIGDGNVRRALALAIDRDALLQDFPGSPAPLQGFVPTEQQAFFVPAWDSYDPDPSRVEELMAASGYSKNSAGFYETLGEELVIDIVAAPGNPVREVYLETIKEQLAEAGIRVDVRLVERLQRQLVRGDFQVAAVAVDATPEPNFRAQFGRGSIPDDSNGFRGANISRFSDAELDRLLDVTAEELDRRKRARAIKDVQRLLADALVLLPLYQWPEVVATRTTLNGITVNPTPVTSFAAAGGWHVTDEPAAEVP